MENKFNKFLTLLTILLFGFGQMWGESWTSANIVNNSGAGTKKGHITVSSPGVTSTTSSQMYKPTSGDAVSENAVSIATSSTVSTLEATPYIEIKADRGYRISAASFYGGAVNNSDQKIWIFCWNTIPIALQTSSNQEYTLQNQKVTSKPADQNITLTSSTRVVRIYSKIKHSSGLIGSGSGVGGGKGAIVSVSVTEALAPEIEGESQMFNDETITLTGYPAGGAWDVVSGPGEIASDGKLTANGNGTIRVSYTVDAVSTTKDIDAAATKDLVWTFDTKDVLPTTAGITATNVDGTFESGGQLKLDNGAYVAIDLTSKDYIITAASINARTGSNSKLINFGSALSTTADGNVNSSSSYADIAITPVKSSSIFSLSKNNSGVYVAKITLTVKKAVACTVAPTVSAATKGATTSTTQVVNCAGISSLGSEGCSISSYGFVYGTGETPNIDDDTPVEVGTTYSTINTAFAETTLTGLTPSTTYYVRAYATNGSGTAYGSAVSFTTSDACTVAPTVSTITKGTTSYTTQILNCAGITSLGSAGCAISSYGFVYGTTEHPTTANTTKEVGTSYTVVSTAFAEMTLTGLTPNTTYYVRAYATNDFGTAYSSNELSFTTLATIGNVAFIASSTSVTNDAITALRDAGYNVTVRTKAASPDYTGVDLVVLDESLSWGSSSDEVGTVISADVPLLNLKAFFYTKGSSARWNWGTPVNPSPLSELATLSTEYTNTASHPIFKDVTITAGAVDMIDPSKSGNNLQGVTTNTLVDGKQGYTLATSATGTTCIHELTPGQRGVTNSKYLLIALSSNIKDNYSDDAKKMIVNAAKYLIGSTAWEPIIAPKLLSSVPANNATDVAVEGNIVLTFSQNVSVLDASKFTLSGGAGSLTTASISVSGAVVTIPYSGLDNSTEYTLATAAGAVKNGSDVPNAALSNIVFTTEAACTKPGAPASLVASDIAYTSATLSWDPSGAGANGYKIALIKKDDETILDWTDEATNSYEATGLTQGTEYTFKIKYKGDGITPGQCEFSNEVTVDFTTTAPSVADLVTIADDYTFTPSATIAAGTLAESNKFFGAGTDDCDYGSGMRVKENRALAFKVNNGARVKVTFTTNGDREMQLGTDKADDDNKAYGHTKTSPATFDVTADGVVYLTASSDLRFSKLEIMYPHTVTYDLNGGTGDPAPTQASKYVGETFSVHDGVTDITAPASKDFDKWVDQDAADVAAGATYTMPAKNVTLTAQWVDHIEPVDPTLTYDDGAYSVGGSALDLSTLITAQTSTGAITYSVKTDGGTSASIDGNNFTATAAGTATITASQAAVVGFNAKTVDFNVVVTEPAEKDGIKMVVAGALTGHFRVKADQLKTGSYTVDGINYTKYVQMGSTHTSFSGETEGNQAKGIYYAPAKKNIKFWFYMRNTDSSTRKIYIYKMEEGSAITSATVDVDPGSQLVSYDMTLATNAEVIFGVENTKLYFCQIVAAESGDDLLQGGQIGYVFDYSMKRQNVAATTLRTIDGIDYYLSAESKINSASNVQLQTLGTHYIKFHLDNPMTVKVTIDGTNKQYYIGTECSTAAAAQTYSATGTEEFSLAAGNWYINGGGVQLKITKLEFIAPKCEQPTITTQPATNVTFGAGNLTATVVAEVSDGGTLSYQWYNASDDSEVTGADEATLTTTTEGTYYVIVTNSLADHQDNSTKSNDATLGYRTLNDATLSALSYGDPATAIALEADKYEYRVILNEGTVDVPALHATATMDPYPTVDITDATSFTDYTAQSTVHVTAEDGVTELTYTVNFIVKHIYTSLEDVTASTTWNWTGSVNQSIDDVPNKGVIIANYIEGDNFEMIEGKAGEYARRNQNGGVYQGTYLHFNTTVPGRVKFYFRAPSGGENCTITVKNGGRTVVAGTRTNSFGWSDEVFVNGDVVVEMVNDKEGGGTTRVQQVVFTTVGPDYTRDMTEGRFGTICLPQAGVMVGATLYEIAYYGATSEKIFLDDIPSGEMEAGVPYVFLPNDGVSTLGVFYTDDEVLAATNHNGLYGYIGASEDDYYTIPDGVGNYIIQNNCYREVQAGAWARIKSNRAYIHLADITPTAPMLAPGRHRLSIGINAPQVTTGLDELNVGDTPVKVMIDGNLYILRGENMYDATGRLVK